MLALHIESLTRRYLLHRVDLLDGLLGLGLVIGPGAHRVREARGSGARGGARAPGSRDEARGVGA